MTHASSRPPSQCLNLWNTFKDAICNYYLYNQLPYIAHPLPGQNISATLRLHGHELLLLTPNVNFSSSPQAVEAPVSSCIDKA